jgi:hypothetical protein
MKNECGVEYNVEWDLCGSGNGPHRWSGGWNGAFAERTVGWIVFSSHGLVCEMIVKPAAGGKFLWIKEQERVKCKGNEDGGGTMEWLQDFSENAPLPHLLLCSPPG